MTPTPDQRANHERAHSAVWHALLYILQWSDVVVRRVKPGAAEAFMAALRQDGYSVALVQPAPALDVERLLREALVTALAVALHEAADPKCEGEPQYSVTQAQAESIADTVMLITRAALAQPAPALDVERLARALAGIGVIDNGTWVSFTPADAEAIAAKYAALEGDPA